MNGITMKGQRDKSINDELTCVRYKPMDNELEVQ